MLRKHEHCSKLLGTVPHEARIISKGHDVALVASVEENDTVVLAPVVDGDEDTLLERGIAGKSEMVNLTGKKAIV